MKWKLHGFFYALNNNRESATWKGLQRSTWGWRRESQVALDIWEQFYAQWDTSQAKMSLWISSEAHDFLSWVRTNKSNGRDSQTDMAFCIATKFELSGKTQHIMSNKPMNHKDPFLTTAVLISSTVSSAGSVMNSVTDKIIWFKWKRATIERSIPCTGSKLSVSAPVPDPIPNSGAVLGIVLLPSPFSAP